VCVLHEILIYVTSAGFGDVLTLGAFGPGEAQVLPE
jgi:hypothetical protein